MKYKKDKPYLITWLDHFSGHEQWTNTDDLDSDTITYQTAGFFVKETPEMVFLALTIGISQDEVSQVMGIVKSAIIAQKQLK